MRSSELKRKTPLKRGGYLKRGTGKNRGKRKDSMLCDLYADKNKDCELTPVLKNAGAPLSDGWDQTVITHHIWPGYRKDCLSNLIRITQALHWDLHNKRFADLTVACLWRKWKKRELNLKEINEAKKTTDREGAQPVHEWLKSQMCIAPQIEAMRKQLVAAIGRRIKRLESPIEQKTH